MGTLATTGPKRSRPPIKLLWLEALAGGQGDEDGGWISAHRDDLPAGVSRLAAKAIAAEAIISASADGSGVVLSARWLNRRLGVRGYTAVRCVRWFAKSGWLEDTGERIRGGAVVYRLTIPS